MNFTPDPERENEVLWGTKEGYEGYLKRTQQANPFPIGKK